MSSYSPVPASDRAPRIGDRAARVLTTELARHAGPKKGVLVDVAAGSTVLAAALDTLLPGDTLTVVPEPGAAAAVRQRVQARGDWVADRVRVVDSVADADPADVVVVAEPLTGSGEAARARIDELAKRLADGGVLAVAGRYGPGWADSAADELSRQAAFYGVGSDVVLRNQPPVHVHRLRFNAADPAVADRLAPAFRTSSVPLTRDMHIDSNGVAAAGIALGLAAFAKLTRPKSKMWLLPALAAAPVAAFFRDPQRDVPSDARDVLAASDGRVLSVQRVRDERFGPDEFLRVAVFLSVLDVHVNRSPVAGRVADYFVETGGYAPAMKPEAEHNVAAYTVLDTAHGRVVVVQRTGLLARRIVHRAPLGSLLARGERFGLIRFGSRTDVYLPASAAQALVAPGDRVLGGVSVIARWND
ncbi:MAG TPA: phosphatidylserine decarboxylase [Micromonosporaceae bacterium]